MTENHTEYRFETLPDAPDGLSEGALKHWHEMMPIIFDLGTARPADLPALVLLCEKRADVDALQDDIRKTGITTQAGSGGLKANPAMRALEATHRQVESLMDRFGLLPGYTPKAPQHPDRRYR